MLTQPIFIETQRLILRKPEERDFEGFCELMTDPEATEHLGGVSEPAVIWRSLASLIGHWAIRGFGFFSIEDKQTGQWLGRVGPWFPHGWYAPEVGWSVLRRCWGQGIATEAAIASMDFAVDTLGWSRVIHVIGSENLASQALARKLGSVNTAERFIVPGFGLETEVWAQSADDWRCHRQQFFASNIDGE
ncbi:MAG: GNAT family N-acetyltransferase [Wenzhouxiangella sp.]